MKLEQPHRGESQWNDEDRDAKPPRPEDEQHDRDRDGKEPGRVSGQSAVEIESQDRFYARRHPAHRTGHARERPQRTRHARACREQGQHGAEPEHRDSGGPQAGEIEREGARLHGL